MSDSISGPHYAPTGQRLYLFRCEWCWEGFRAVNLTARTCSDAHRLRLSRWCRRFEQVHGKPAVHGPRGDRLLQDLPHLTTEQIDRLIDGLHRRGSQ